MIRIHHWNGQTSEHGGTELLPESADEVPPDHVLWISLSQPSVEEEARVFEQFFRIHPLSLEDVTRMRREPESGAHLPKVEEFSNYLFVIVNPLPPAIMTLATRSLAERGTLPHSGTMLLRRARPQVSAVITQNILITHATEEVDCIGAAERYVERHVDAARRGPDYIFHLILDAMVDEYAPVVEWIARKLDRLESRVFTQPTRQLITRILKLKRMVSTMRKTLIIEREVLARLIRSEFDLVDEREIVYYRNVYDHLVRYTELIESAREMVSDLGETHLAAVSNKLNEVMKVLAIISTIILPMTLISSIYGMNFKFMPELEWTLGYPMAIGLMALTTITALTIFRWRKWI